MKKVLIFILLAIGLIGCSITKPTLPPATNQTIIHHIDSITYHDSTIYHTVYKEIYKDYTKLLDTLYLETTYSKFKTYVDTSSNILKGEAANKTIDIPVKIKWKEKTVYKDSIQVKEVPYPVEVSKEVTKYPATYWWFMGFTILVLIYFGIKLYLKFKI